MSKYNSGYIFTTEKCIGCGRCILSCPSEESNVSGYRNGMRHIDVNPANCIDCGACVTICDHGAREYADDTERLFSDLENGESVSLIVSPSLHSILGEKTDNLLGFFRSKGINRIYDCGIGSKISVWAVAEFIKNYDGVPAERPFLTSFCPSIVSYIERYHPDTLKYLIPVHSPLLCTAIYLRKYLGVTDRIAFVGTCISKKNETESEEAGGNVDYCLTVDHLLKYIGNTDISGLHASFDMSSDSSGRAVDDIMGYREFLAACFPDEEAIIFDSDLDSKMKKLISTSGKVSASQPLVAVIAACKDGCGSGNGAGRVVMADPSAYYERLRNMRSDAIRLKKSFPSYKEFYEALCESYKDLDLNDFRRGFKDRYVQRDIVPENIINEIFNKMRMGNEASRHVDCRACGYPTCRSMAAAVAKGYARIEDCSRYVTGEFRKKLYFDDVTGLLSSQGFHIEGSMMMQAHPEKKYVIAAGNINGIKTINDLYNFNVGSQVIVYVAHMLSTIANGIGICARLGGNIFVLCIENSRENLRRLMAIKYFDCGEMGINMPVTMRFGLCEVSGIRDLARIVNYASFAMEKNTDRSKNTFKWYDEDMRREIMIESSITSQMRTAMYKNEFTMYLQPQYNHSNGKIVGAESLCRWIKADGSIVSPGLFIPIFEKNGFIRSLDRFMWEAAFKQVKSWVDAGIEPVPISVNISRKSLVDDEIINVISKLKETYKIDPSLLHFEITESAYTSEQDDLITRICRIRDMGFKIAMDDFGSGYSSLNTLKDIPIDILKLDMGFLRGDSNREKGGSIIGSVIRMSHDLGLITIAEGVETAEQADFLKSMGCDVIQGFLYAKPMPVDDYNKLLAENESERVVYSASHHIDVNSLFDHGSSGAKIFDKLSGPAVIYEYKPGSVDIIKINDSFIDMFGFAEYPFTEFSTRLVDGIDKDDIGKVREALQKALSDDDQIKCTFRYTRPDGKTIYARIGIWHIADNGEKSIMYTIADDVSDLIK